MQSRVALENFLTNVLELKSEYLIWKTLNHNGCECIEDSVNISDTDIQNLHYKNSTKELEFISIGHQQIIWSFIDYLKYITYNNDPIGDDLMNITANNFNDFHMKYYYNFIRLREYVLVNTRPTSPNLSYKQHYPVNNIKIPIKCNPDPPKFDIVTPLCNGNKLIN